MHTCTHTRAHTHTLPYGQEHTGLLCIPPSFIFSIGRTGVTMPATSAACCEELVRERMRMSLAGWKAFHSSGQLWQCSAERCSITSRCLPSWPHPSHTFLSMLSGSGWVLPREQWLNILLHFHLSERSSSLWRHPKKNKEMTNASMGFESGAGRCFLLNLILVIMVFLN